MKQAFTLMTVLVLTLCVLTGCGCRNSRPAETVPTTTPTLATVPTTESTTVPTTRETQPATDATIPDGNGPLTTDETVSTDPTDAARGRTGGMAGAIDGNTGTGSGITGSIG